MINKIVFKRNIVIKNNYFIKLGYKARLNPKYFEDIQKEKIVYQPDVYRVASLLAEKYQASSVIDIGCGNAEKLVKFCGNYKLTAIDFGQNFSKIKEKHPKLKLIECNLDKDIPEIKEDELKDSIIICSDVIEHLVRPEILLSWLKRISTYVSVIILTTPERDLVRGYESFGPPENDAHVREWNLSEFNDLLTNSGISPTFLGLTLNNDVDKDKKTIIAIYDRRVDRAENLDKALKVQVIVTSFNEKDIISQTINYLADQGLHVHVIDNWSTDGTLEKIKQIASNNEFVTYERFPTDGPLETFDWGKILEYVGEISRNKLHADWYIHHDADEIRESPFIRYRSLKKAIEIVDSAGFNAIDFTCLEFVPVKEGFNEDILPSEFFYYYDFGKRPGHFTQIKAWKSNKDVDLSKSGGHKAIFQNQRVFPYNFLLKHYPFRSQMQAEKKIFKDRKDRWNKEEKEMGWHIQYDYIKKGHKFIKDPRFYKKYHYVDFYYLNLLERILRVGINKQD